jgi:hypothetical protein
MATKKMTAEEKAKIAAELQNRVKAIAILSFHKTNSVDMNTLPDSQKLVVISVTATLNMKSKARWYRSHYSISAKFDKVPGIQYSGYSGRWPREPSNIQIIVARTREQFPKCSSIPDSQLTYTTNSATPEEVEWAQGILENMGITDESGSYKVIFETTVKVRRTVTAGLVLNPRHAQMQALKELTVNSGWFPVDTPDPNLVDIVKVEKY